MSNVQPLVAPNGIIRKEKKPYNEDEALNLLTTLAAELRISPKTHDFDESEFLPITYLPLESLYTDATFQRLVDKSFINNAKKFDAKLFSPVVVFKRPNGKHTVGDGQHESIIAILYTQKGAKTKVPCYLHVHPSHYTTKECVSAEANFFVTMNKRRNNVGQLSQLRAGISYGEPDALSKEAKLIDMGVHLEKIGNPEGPEVHGLTKILKAHGDYGVGNVISAIEFYQRLQDDPTFPKWNDHHKPLNGGLIGGLSAVFYLKNTELGHGDKAYALSCFLNEYVGKYTPKDLCLNTAGPAQAILIARRIVAGCNNLIMADILTKRNGEILQHEIKEDVMSNAGLGAGDLDIKTVIEQPA